jgi:hypothetical protein
MKIKSGPYIWLLWKMFQREIKKHLVEKQIILEMYMFRSQKRLYFKME